MMRFLRDQRGITLVEMMVALSLAAVAAAVVYTIFVSTQGAYQDTKSITQTQSDARVVLGVLAQEIRSAGSDPDATDNVSFEALVVCWGDSLRLQSDHDGDGVIAAGGVLPEDVFWFIDSGAETLVRRTGAGDMTLLRNVTGFSVSYLDNQGIALTAFPLDVKARSQVRALQIDLQIRVNRDLQRTWTTTATLRNDSSL